MLLVPGVAPLATVSRPAPLSVTPPGSVPVALALTVAAVAGAPRRVSLASTSPCAPAARLKVSAVATMGSAGGVVLSLPPQAANSAAVSAVVHVAKAAGAARRFGAAGRAVSVLFKVRSFVVATELSGTVVRGVMLGDAHRSALRCTKEKGPASAGPSAWGRKSVSERDRRFGLAGGRCHVADIEWRRRLRRRQRTRVLRVRRGRCGGAGGHLVAGRRRRFGCICGVVAAGRQQQRGGRGDEQV